MAVVPLSTPNSFQKQVTYNINQKLLATTQGSVPGLQDEIKEYPKSIAGLVKRIIGSESGYGFFGLETVSNTTNTITTGKGYVIDASFNIYYLENLVLATTGESYWGFFEIEFVEESSDEVTLEFVNPSTVPKTYYTQTAPTKKIYTIKVYENYNTSNSFPSVTAGRIKWLEYKKDAAFGSITETTNYLESDIVMASDIIDDLTTGGAKKPLSAEQGKELSYSIIPIGAYIAIDGNVEPDPTRFIKLTKDLDGVGGYNEGKLTGQSTVVTGEQTFYTAIVNDALSPKFGEVINLVNSTIDNNSGLTAPTVISASETSGLVRHNRFQGHWHQNYAQAQTGQSGGSNIALFNYSGTAPNNLAMPSGDSIREAISDGVNGTPRTGFTTEQNNITANYYMRIK